MSGREQDGSKSFAIKEWRRKKNRSENIPVYSFTHSYVNRKFNYVHNKTIYLRHMLGPMCSFLIVQSVDNLWGKKANNNPEFVIKRRFIILTIPTTFVFHCFWVF